MNDAKFKLEKPLFYNHTYGLRFEIGPPEIGVWANFEQGRLNEKYFGVALDRALSIFEAVFSPVDDISIAYQIFSDGRRKIQKGNFIFKQINCIKQRKVFFTDHMDGSV